MSDSDSRLPEGRALIPDGRGVGLYFGFSNSVAQPGIYSATVVNADTIVLRRIGAAGNSVPVPYVFREEFAALTYEFCLTSDELIKFKQDDNAI